MSSNSSVVIVHIGRGVTFVINYNLYQRIKDKGNAWLTVVLIVAAAVVIGIALLPSEFVLLKAIAAAYILLP